MSDPNLPWTRVAAYGILVKDGAMLLCRLCHPESDAGMWTLPGGGLDFGEHPESGMVRELLEETGFHVRPGKLLAVDSRHFANQVRPVHAIRILYQAEIIGGELTHETHGSTDHCAWIPFEEAENLPLVELARLGLETARKLK